MANVNGVLGKLRVSATAKWVVAGVGALLIVVGSVFGAVAADTYREGEATKAWPSTTGEILSTDVEEDVRRERRDNGSYRTRRTYTPVVTYAYEVDGVAYTGHRIRADDASGDRDRAYNIINSYPVGSEATVYFDPDDHDSAVLRQGAEAMSVWVFGGVGGLLVVLGLVGVVGATVLRRGG